MKHKNITFDQWIDAWDLNVRIDETGQDDPERKYYVEVWDDNETASVYSYGSTEQEAKDKLVKTYGDLPESEDKCRYCGLVTEDDSGECSKCYHEYEERSQV